MRDHPFKLGKKKQKRQTMATEEEACALLAIASQRQEGNGDSHTGDNLLSHANMYAILWFILQTGARPEEACGLLVQDIKRHDQPPPNRPNIWMDATIRNTVTFDDGFTENHTKTGEFRPAQLGQYALDAFNKVERLWQAKRMVDDGYRLSRSGNIYLKPGASCERAAMASSVKNVYLALLSDETPLEVRDHGLMFVNRSGRPYNSTTLGNMMRKLVTRAEIYARDRDGRVIMVKDRDDKLVPKPRVSLYDFRHLVATFNADALPTHVAAGVTGHNTETFQRHYVHGRKGDQLLIAGAAGQLEQRLAKMLPAPTATKVR
jgi:integrase